MLDQDRQRALGDGPVTEHQYSLMEVDHHLLPPFALGRQDAEADRNGHPID